MRPWALVFLLALPAPAQDSADGPSETGLRAQKARELVDALPIEARVELKKMYRRFKNIVERRLEEGWRPAVLSEAVIGDLDEPFQPARLVEEMLAERLKEVEKLQEAQPKESDNTESADRLRRVLRTKSRELSALKARDKREKGVCRDWSDQVWSELSGMQLEHWSARDERRGMRPYHTAAVACSPSDSPSVCLVFDPWADGRPNVFAYAAWDESEPGGRFPAEYFQHVLPDKVGSKK